MLSAQGHSDTPTTALVAKWTRRVLSYGPLIFLQMYQLANKPGDGVHLRLHKGIPGTHERF